MSYVRSEPGTPEGAGPPAYDNPIFQKSPDKVDKSVDYLVTNWWNEDLIDWLDGFLRGYLRMCFIKWPIDYYIDLFVGWYVGWLVDNQC